MPQVLLRVDIGSELSEQKLGLFSGTSEVGSSWMAAITRIVLTVPAAQINSEEDFVVDSDTANSEVFDWDSEADDSNLVMKLGIAFEDLDISVSKIVSARLDIYHGTDNIVYAYAEESTLLLNLLV